jgi:hypothetical protein
MTELKKKIFRGKIYQYGYNDAMQVALDHAAELNAEIRKLQATIDEQNEFIKHDYISMKNHVEKTQYLEATVTRLRNEVERYDKRVAKALNILSGEIQTTNAPTYLWNAIYALRGVSDE